MTIKDGYNQKETDIIFEVGAGSKRTAGVWLRQQGLEDVSNPKTGSETLAYATLDELLDLQDELKEVIQELTA